MIAVDTSVLAAIAFNESECAAFRSAIRNSEHALISAASVVEARIVVYRRLGKAGMELLEDLLSLPAFEIIYPNASDLPIIQAAFVKYGKGSGHPAQLNFGDLFSYALAKSRGVPLLFKGDDFAATDIGVAG